MSTKVSNQSADGIGFLSLDSLAFGPLKPATACLDARTVLQLKGFSVWLAAVGIVRRGKQAKHSVKGIDDLI